LLYFLSNCFLTAACCPKRDFYINPPSPTPKKWQQTFVLHTQNSASFVLRTQKSAPSSKPKKLTKRQQKRLQKGGKKGGKKCGKKGGKKVYS
jgi:hypothetical protein